jgi:hypothetical protein
MSTEFCVDDPVAPLAGSRAAEAPARPIRFLHIRKTGGTTMHSLLGDLVATERSARASELRHAAITSRITPNDRARYLYIHGHGAIDWFEEPGAFLFAFFRDPLARFLSERRQWSQASDEDLAAAPEAPSRAMALFRTLDIWGFIDAITDHPIAMTSVWNHQTLSMGLWPVLAARLGRERCEELAFGEPCTLFGSGREFLAFLESEAEAILDVALAKLHRLSFIGLADRIEEDVPLLCRHLGLPPAPRVPVLNARSAIGDESLPGVAEAIAPFIRLDEILLREARRIAAARPALRPSARADYLGRRVGRGGRVEVDAAAAPGGPGWHPHHVREDGRFSRWSRDQPCLSFRGEMGGYVLALDVFGAVEESALLGARLRCGDRVTDFEAGVMPDGVWRLRAPFALVRDGLCDLAILLPAEGELGLEVAGFTITADDWVAPLPVCGHGAGCQATRAALRRHGEDRVRGHVAVKQAIAALRAQPAPATEMEAVLAFGRVAEAFCRRFDLAFPQGWERAGGCLSPADVFAAVIDLAGAGAEAAGLPVESRARLAEEVRGHAAYALARLADVSPPPGFGPVELVPDAPGRGDPRAVRMMGEAVMNFATLLDWLADEATRQP